jgi:chitinase
MKKYNTVFIALIYFICCTACKKSEAGPVTPNYNGFRVVGYLMVDGDDALAKAQQLNFSALTHLNLAFINPNAQGDFANNDKLAQITALAHTNKVKVLLSLGGGDIPNYLTSFLKDDKRTAFIQKLVAITEKYNFDGIDVDLEGNAVNSNYSKFVTEIAIPLKAKGKLITTAIATWFGSNVTDSALNTYDFINVMSYDATGPWEPSKPGQHAPYQMAVDDINYWHTTRGVAKEKLNLGVPFYGYGFGANHTTSDMFYRDIIAKYPGAENKDSILLANGQTMYYNGIPTIKKKTAFALQQTGGIMIWELSQDATGNLSLLKSIKDVIEGK